MDKQIVIYTYIYSLNKILHMHIIFIYVINIFIDNIYTISIYYISICTIIYFYIFLHLLRFNPWVGKIPWRRPWQPTPVFLPGESHEQRSLAGLIHSVAKSRTRLKWLSTHTCTHLLYYIYIYIYLYIFSGILLSNKKKQTVNTHNSVDGSQDNYAVTKAKQKRVWWSIYINCRDCT